MRLSLYARLGAVAALALCVTCDTPSVAGKPATGVATVSIPRSWANVVGVSAQTNNGSGNGGGDDVVSATVDISIVGDTRSLLSRSLDISTCDNKDSTDPNTPLCSLTVQFPVPAGADGATFQFVVNALDAAGNVAYRIGPTQFTLGPGGQGGSVESQAIYVGPGNDANGVLLSPRSLSLAVGQTASATCVATRNGVPLSATPPMRVSTANNAVANANFGPGTSTTRTSAIQVFGTGPGTTQLNCELDFGTFPPDAINVTVTGGGGGTQLQLVSGQNQTGTAGQRLPSPIVVRVVNGVGQPISGAPISVVSVQGGSAVSPNSGSTDATGQFTMIWTLASAVGTQTLVLGTPNAPNLIVTANAVAASPGSIPVTVRSASNNSALSGITVELRVAPATTGTALQSGSTSTSGAFTFTNVLPGTYTVRATGSGFQDASGTVTVISGGTSPLTLLMSPTASTVGAIIGTVSSATTGLALPSATLELRSGLNNTSTTPTTALASTSTTNGSFTFSALSTGQYTVRAIASGYADAFANATVTAGQSTPLTIAMSPTQATGAVRIVLTWGATPPDLDAHLTTPDGTEVYWANQGNCTAAPFACLDHDDTDGNGPETITIAQIQTGTYTFRVHDFTDDTGGSVASPGLAQSGATVQVYFGNTLQATYTVPSQQGVLWTVFKLSGTTLTPVNTIGTVGPSGVPPAIGATGSLQAMPIKKKGN